MWVDVNIFDITLKAFGGLRQVSQKARKDAGKGTRAEEGTLTSHQGKIRIF